MRTLFLILCLAFTSCDFTDQIHQTSDPELRPFLELFHQEALKRGHDYRSVDVSLILVKELRTAGLTTYKSIPVAQVNLDYFNERVNGDEYQRRALEFVVFHELGHAIFMRGHAEGDGELMSEHPPIHDYAKYPDKREAMLNRFFK